MLVSLRAAVAFLTRLPVGPGALDAAGMRRAAAWFPLVGLIVGGVAAGTRALAGLALDPAPSAVLGLIAAIVVTGGLHEDGLADCADAFGAHVDRARRLEILRDPRLGTFGVLALVCAFAFALVLVAGLSAAAFARAVIGAQMIGRGALLLVASLVPPARADGSGALLSVGPFGLAFACTCAAGCALLCGGVVGGLLALLVAACCAAVVGALAWRLLGGTTGDVFGATVKLAELGVLAVLATRLG